MKKKYFNWDEISAAQKDNQRRYVQRDGGARHNLSARMSQERKKSSPNHRKLADMERAYAICQEIFGVYKPRARAH